MMSHPFMSLEGKHLLVAGAGSDIGKATAEGARALGAVVQGVARQPQEDPAVTPVNLLDDEALKGWVRELAQPLDGLVFCIGQALLMPAHMLGREVIARVMDVNVGSFVALLAALLRARKLNAGASIVALSSISAHTATEGVTPYAMSKAALSAGVRNLALELQRRDIRINAVSPAMVRTKMTAGSDVFSLEEMARERYPMGVASPDDVAALVLFLLSDEAVSVTGWDTLLTGGVVDI
ncbi:SDR family NAD(P)-dependent oxidoreductase [Bordetella genomosp. 12]|uniref:Short-chain dehydrogenase n=1 Tax=Bordetella genomosp. 12 TaxID=463035 RepID=A0A261VUF0_9BORD|nr:SDR family oxidoreductase [Bordetella genomosp. 12]OZI77391.1 short-chain dehydrogenase [Bordetella genomosp. 12]